MSENVETSIITAVNEDLPRYYINSVQVVAGAYDVMLKCGLVSPFTSSLQDLATIIMSPSHAKVLGKLLTDTIKDYEEKNNVIIPVPTVSHEVK